MKHAFIVFAAFLFVSCAGSSVTMLTPDKFHKTEFVQLLMEEPEKEYVQIALIEGKASQYSSRSEAFKVMLKDARKIGAHALVIAAIEKGYQPGSTHANPVAGGEPITIIGGETHTITGIAIRYTPGK